MGVNKVGSDTMTFSVGVYGKNAASRLNSASTKSGSLLKSGSKNISMRIDTKDGDKKDTVSVMLSSGETSASSSKKELKYSYKELSRAITKAKTSQSAGMVAAQIRAKITHLYSLLDSGEYDAEEVMAAIAHAEMMEQAALKRQANLEAEEEAARAIERKENEEALAGETGADITGSAVKNTDGKQKADIDILKEIKKQLKDAKSEEAKQMRQLRDDLEKAMDEFNNVISMYDSMDDMNKALSGEMTPEELEEMKKRHRAQENALVEISDTAYLKAKFDRLQKQLEANKAGAVTGYTFASRKATLTQTASAAVASGTGSDTVNIPSPTGTGGSSSQGSVSGSAAVSVDVSV